LGFGFDDEEGFGVGAARRAVFCARVFERVGQDSEDDATVRAPDKIETTFLLNEF
jgi:hypothetical protein